jgi:hypothetical protein
VNEIRSLPAVWNQGKALYGIDPKENTPAVMPYAFGDSMHPAGDAMPILRIG